MDRFSAVESIRYLHVYYDGVLTAVAKQQNYHISKTMCQILEAETE